MQTSRVACQADAVTNQLKLVRRRNDALQNRVNELEQAHRASSASKSSPMSKVEELKARVSRVEHERDEALRQVRSLEAARALEAKQPQALHVAIVYDRSLSEFESVAGLVLLGYNRRGHLLESLFHLIAGDAPGIADRLPGVITAVAPDLAAGDERRPDTGRALRALVTALESSQDPEEGQVSSQRSSLFGFHDLPTADEVQSAHAPLPDSSTASGSSLVGASRQAADALPKSQSPPSKNDPPPAGVSSPTHSPDASPRVDSKNRPLRVASSPDDDASEAEEEEDRHDDSGSETESRLNDDAGDEESARSEGSDVSADDDDETIRFPNAVPLLGPVTKLLRSDLSTVRASRASFAKSRGDFNSFVQRAIAYRAESDIDGMWPEEPSSYMERSRMLNFPREASWMLGLFEGEISTPTTQEYPELVRAAGSHPVDARDLGVYYKPRPWAASADAGGFQA
ncbi:hypothetical protein PINS_up016447 [Pythium insidiosum]|nr:hypothetical protein PINS_up016447 [Pythium insidiosum]